MYGSNIDVDNARTTCVKRYDTNAAETVDRKHLYGVVGYVV